MIKPKVLFLCGANSCRTQMAEGFLRDLARDHFDVMSAGYEPSEQVCSDAIEAMCEVGIDISRQRPKKTDALLGQRVSFVITCMRPAERAVLPHFPRRDVARDLATGRSADSRCGRRATNRHAPSARRNTPPRDRVCQ